MVVVVVLDMVVVVVLVVGVEWTPYFPYEKGYL